MGNGGEHVRIQLWPVRPVHFSTLVSMVWLALLHDKDSCAGKFPSFDCYGQFNPPRIRHFTARELGELTTGVCSSLQLFPSPCTYMA